MKVGNLVVRHLVVGGLANPDALAAEEKARAVVDEAIVQDVPLDAQFRRVLERARSNEHRAAADVVDVAATDDVVGATAVEPERVLTGAGDPAVLEDAVPQSPGGDERLALDGALLAGRHVGRDVTVGVLE